MRPLTDAARLQALMDALGRAGHHPARIYLTGGASAVLLAWRSSTVDVDLTMDPDRDEIYRAIATRDVRCHRAAALPLSSDQRGDV